MRAFVLILVILLSSCEAIDDRPMIINKCNKTIYFSNEHNFSSLRLAYEYYASIDSIGWSDYWRNKREVLDSSKYCLPDDTSDFVRLPPSREHRYTRLGEIEDYVFHADSSSFHILIVSEDSLKNNRHYIMYKNNIISKKLSYTLDSLKKMNWIINISCEDLE